MPWQRRASLGRGKLPIRQPAGVELGENFESSVNLAFAAGLEDIEPKPFRMRRILRLSYHVLRIQIRTEDDRDSRGRALRRERRGAAGSVRAGETRMIGLAGRRSDDR
jgi:hypothetical protein